MHIPRGSDVWEKINPKPFPAEDLGHRCPKGLKKGLELEEQGNALGTLLAWLSL